jgi:hypothetical protein
MVAKANAKYTLETKARVVSVRYMDHVLFNRCDPLVMKPMVRECVGWLVYECAEYIILSWDCDAGPPTLKAGDPRASGLVILRSAIVEVKETG